MFVKIMGVVLIRTTMKRRVMRRLVVLEMVVSGMVPDRARVESEADGNLGWGVD